MKVSSEYLGQVRYQGHQVKI